MYLYRLGEENSPIWDWDREKSNWFYQSGIVIELGPKFGRFNIKSNLDFDTVTFRPYTEEACDTSTTLTDVSTGPFETQTTTTTAATTTTTTSPAGPAVEQEIGYGGKSVGQYRACPDKKGARCFLVPGADGK